MLRRPRVEPPVFVRLESCTLCQLNCVGCFMRKGNYCKNGAGYLKFQDFVKFAAANPSVKAIELSNAGEIFLNPDLENIIRYAFARGITLIACNGSNFNSAGESVMRAMVECKFAALTISLDGACQETYAKYRRGGDFNVVIENIKRLNQLKREYNSEFPRLNWQYVILASNDSESEIKRAKAMAAELGMNIYFRKDWDSYVPRDPDMIRREAGLDYGGGGADKSPDFLRYRSGRYLPCFNLFKSPQINWDGRFLACCSSHMTSKEFGYNGFKTSLEKILASKIVRDSKRMLMGEGVCRESPCFECAHYKSLCAENSFITQKEIDEAKV